METTVLSDIQDPEVRELIEASAKAMEKAYNPYSKFSVGAALRSTDDKSIVTGCNVENVSFGLTICAERTALVKSVSEGKRHFDSVAVSAVNEDCLVTPCGACRQFLAEFNENIVIYLFNPKTQKVAITNLQYLLPQAILPTNLNSTLFK